MFDWKFLSCFNWPQMYDHLIVTFKGRSIGTGDSYSVNTSSELIKKFVSFEWFSKQNVNQKKQAPRVEFPKLASCGQSRSFYRSTLNHQISILKKQIKSEH